MASIDTPLLIVGHGPAALVTAKVVAGRGRPCLLADHRPIEDTEPVVLDDPSLAALEPNGVLGVLRPYAAAQDPFTIAPLLFEQGLKHHCVADMLVTVFDELAVEDLVTSDSGASATLTDGRSRWAVAADALIDLRGFEGDLNDAIHHGAELADQLAPSA